MITIKTIPHLEQRYPTCGDWWWDGENLEIRVSNMNNPTFEWLVAEHEINEALMCKRDGITGKQVDEFDIAFENLRELNPNLIGDQEPGHMISAPYNKQHCASEIIEKISAVEHGVNWQKYEEALNKL